MRRMGRAFVALVLSACGSQPAAEGGLYSRALELRGAYDEAIEAYEALERLGE